MIESRLIVFAVLVLLFRWCLLPEVAPIRKAGAVWLAGLQVLAWWVLWMGVGMPFWQLCVGALAMLSPLVLLLERRRGLRGERSGLRVLLLGVALGTACLFTWCEWRGAFEVSWSIRNITTGEHFMAWFQNGGRAFFGAVVWLGGALVCLKENNFCIRWLMGRIRGGEQGRGGVIQVGTDNGRIIGCLERLLVYVLLSNGQFLAVTAVVGIKALARFKRMEEDQAFAEYVIIGTFASLLLACGAVACVRWLGSGV